MVDSHLSGCPVRDLREGRAVAGRVGITSFHPCYGGRDSGGKEGHSENNVKIVRQGVDNANRFA